MSVIKLELGEGNVLLRVVTENQIQTVSFPMLNAACPYALNLDSESLEYINAEVCGKYVVCCVTTAQGQGGLVFVWDTEAQVFIHFSNGEFAVKAVLHNQNVYVLRQISYWGVRAHLRLDYCTLGTKTPDSVFTEIPLDKDTSENLSADPANYEIIFDGETPIIRVME